MTRGQGRRALVCAVLLAVVAAGVLGQGAAARSADALPTPRLFRIAASQLPWHADFLLTARVEGNSQARLDGIILYGSALGSASWSAPHRVTGWYEDALMKRGGMAAVVDILVSEFRQPPQRRCAAVWQRSSCIRSRSRAADQSLRNVQDCLSCERSFSEFLGDLCYLCPRGLDLDSNIETTAGDKSSKARQIRSDGIADVLVKEEEAVQREPACRVELRNVHHGLLPGRRPKNYARSAGCKHG
jgi:hypothetical protein